MNEDETKYLVGLSGFVGLGIKHLNLLRQYFGSAKQIWLANTGEWVKVGIGQEMAYQWENWRGKTDLDREMERLARLEIKLLLIEDINYPKLLKQIEFAPFLLYVKGDISELNRPAIAIVGSRKMTEYGRRVTSLLVSQLAKKLTIVSGLARGVDGWAHRVCLQVGGKTIAVLGHGLDRIYPPENRPLAEDVIKRGGVLISEYPLGYPINKINFPQRDRIIAGLTQGTLVIEGGQKSGTKITAGFAADYGREVFCVPGPIDSATSSASAELIQQGAKLVTRVEDIYEELNIDS
jgi:DNA processing protein